MSGSPDIVPGTVSKILWHFTGGPTWNDKTKKQNTSPKPSKNAYRNLNSILESRKLRVGTYKETVKVIIPKRRRFDLKTRQTIIEENVPVVITSSSVCCLSDIPAPHLRYHAYRYGKFAIGFYRDAIIKHGFNPVLYTLTDTSIVRSIYEGFSSFDFADPFQIKMSIDTINSAIDDAESEFENLNLSVSSEISDIEMEADKIESSIDDAKESLKKLVAFIKTFEKDEFSSIYCEREWRSTQQYNFDVKDVAMIVIPKVVSNTYYFNDFVDNVASMLSLPRRIPIVPWEDLIEH
ncbi:abortive infection system antitoxin AbiGi family protein [Desulfotignum phosphitoxidans]|jgi:hypothetical protein|uniref:Uncharacterized protein n=1 Tax=Desulfotignum phosphitoxidans DSM 13687 TaxID=1286635 RepID=S0G5J9_9BACT|nr:abortive infection system antitoxin AbiGi family protein [Desulfotignum phosphitoxidans]EMS79782.1 hypothetical protein DUF2743 [Desulfotignum phosphitoxidans DSM 13687]